MGTFKITFLLTLISSLILMCLSTSIEFINHTGLEIENDTKLTDGNETLLNIDTASKFFETFDILIVQKGAPSQAISCKSESSEIQWMFNNQNLSDETNIIQVQKDNTSYLIFPPMEESHSGNYTCLNDLGQIEMTLEVEVINDKSLAPICQSKPIDPVAIENRPIDPVVIENGSIDPVVIVNGPIDPAVNGSIDPKNPKNRTIDPAVNGPIDLKNPKNRTIDPAVNGSIDPKNPKNRTIDPGVNGSIDPKNPKNRTKRSPWYHWVRSNSKLTKDLQTLSNLIAQRLLLADKVAIAKYDTNKPIEDLPREEIILQNVVKQAQNMGLNPDWARLFFTDQITANKDIQFYLVEEWKKSGQRPVGPGVDLQKEIRPIIDHINNELMTLSYRTNTIRRLRSCQLKVEQVTRYTVFYYGLDNLHQKALQKATNYLCL